jgi:signal peptidase I
MSARSTFIETFQTVVISFVVYILIHLFIAQPNKVDGNSMFPTMHTGERILTSKVTYRLNMPHRGEIIIFTPPDEKKGDYVKRIIGMPGETIMLSKGDVYINGQRLNESYLPEGTRTAEKKFLREGIPFQIPADNFIVLGDNRNFSSDSREWGPVVKSEIIGKAWLQYWPLNEISLVKHT